MTRDSPASLPLILTADRDLLDDLLRLCAAAGTEAETASDVGAARRAWSSAPLVLLGPDVLPEVRRRALARRDGVILLDVRESGEGTPWEDAVGVGVREVLRLPGDEAVVVDRLAEAVDPGDPARVIAVVGGSGGVGASTLAAGLAVTAAREGGSALLVDADPWGGGIDLLLGAEDDPGLRWPALSGARGRIGPIALREALPLVDGVRVLSAARPVSLLPEPGALSAVLTAARRGGGTVVVDTGRRLDDSTLAVVTTADEVLLLVGADVRGAASGAAAAAVLAPLAARIGAVVRPRAPAGLGADALADLLGLALWGVLPTDTGLPAAAERGLAPARSGRGPFVLLCRSLLAAAPVAV